MCNFSTEGIRKALEVLAAKRGLSVHDMSFWLRPDGSGEIRHRRDALYVFSSPGNIWDLESVLSSILQKELVEDEKLLTWNVSRIANAARDLGTLAAYMGSDRVYVTEGGSLSFKLSDVPRIPNAKDIGSALAQINEDELEASRREERYQKYLALKEEFEDA